MKNFDLNLIPLMIDSKEITKTQAVEKLAVFVQNNYKIFNISEEDEDLKSEIVLSILEKGLSLLNRYNSSYGSFFNYFFCFVKSSTSTIRRKKVNHNLYDYHSITESILNYSLEEEFYTNSIELSKKIKKAPYNYKKIDPEVFQIACKDHKYSIKKYLKKHSNDNSNLSNNLNKISPLKIKKILLVLALKSSYYIDDEQIMIISEICEIDYEILSNTIQQIKDELIERENHKKLLEQRRNKAYFHHQKYKTLINYLKDNNEKNDKFKILNMQNKYIRHTNCWIDLNNKLKKGTINIRPTNKTVAQILGICERQVSYYIKNVENLDL